MILRDYQQEAVDQTLDWLRDHQSALIVAPTGVGKTVIFAHIIKRISERGRVMVLAHRTELLAQAANKIQSIAGVGVDWEKGSQRADAGLFKAPCLVTSVQTQVSGRNGTRRMQRFNPHEFAMLVVDEAHHAVSASYRETIAHYASAEGCKIVGVTATPNRADERALGQVFQHCPFEMRLDGAIELGWLVNVEGARRSIKEFDLSRVNTVAGDLSPKQQAAVLEEKKVLAGMALPTFELAEDRKTLVFAHRVAQARDLCAVLNEYRTGCAQYIHGKTPEDVRRQMLSDFHQSRFQFLVNCDVVSEGFDVPDVQCVSLCFATKSLPKLIQRMGRGMRPLDGLVDQGKTPGERLALIAGSAKPNLLIIDFGGNFGRHRVATPLDALGGNYDDEVVAMAEHAMNESDDPRPLYQVLLDAKIQAAENYRLRTEEEERRAEQMRHFGVRVKYAASSFDPFRAFQIDIPRVSAFRARERATSPQIALLEKFKVENPDRLAKAEASALIGSLIARRKAGLCTYPQAKLLRSQGYDPKGMTFADAHAVIGSIMAKWRRPKHRERSRS